MPKNKPYTKVEAEVKGKKKPAFLVKGKPKKKK